jgi:type I restriction enzyme M protein
MKPQQKTLTGGNATPHKRVKKKQEALTVRRYIDDILVRQLSIPSHQIVNDITFVAYTGSKRPDILVSEFEYDPQQKNEAQFIENLVAYAEAKDDCVVGDKDWEDAKQQGFIKAPKLNLPFFIVTNCKHTIFYNLATKHEISLNGNPIREFQTIDILRLIKNRLTKNPLLNNIMTNVDSLSIISEAVFNKKLWELAKVYRNINFENNVQKIDFTIGFISLEYFEERETEGNQGRKQNLLV